MDSQALGKAVSCVVATLAIAFAFSCNKRQGETSSAARSVDTEQPSPSRNTTPPHSKESLASTPADPALQERLAHEKWHGDLDSIVKRRFLRVLVAPNKLAFYFDGGELHGAIYEFSREFERYLNKKLHTGNLAIQLVFVPASRDSLLPKLAAGYGDLVATLMVTSSHPPYAVDFTDPIFDKTKEVIVSGPGEQLSSLEDLSGREVYYFKNTIPYEKLRTLSERLRQDGKPPIRLTSAAEDLQTDDLLEMVNAGLVPMTIAEDRVAQYWAQVLPNLKVHSDITVTEAPVAWVVQHDTPQLTSVVNEFIRDHKVGTAYGNTVAAKYLSRVNWAKSATAGEGLSHFEELVSLFRKYGDQYHFPYLLLAAQGYQESGLNQGLRSKAGAVGIMQIKPGTAAADPIDITGIEKTDRNIEAGAKYLRYMVSHYYAHEPMDPVTKGLFALASYNAGPARIEKIRTQAAAEGYDKNLWFNNVEFVAAREIGAETCNYVGNIYKYYLAYKMIGEQRARRQRSRSARGPAPSR
jgi:membrane-bound lytic murein transglycosylase MltF